MGWFTGLELNSLDELLLVQLQDLYDAEFRLLDAIPKMAEAANCGQVKWALLQHLEEACGHVTRLEQIFHDLGVEPQRMTSQAMKGLIAEGIQVLSASGDCCVKDAAIVAAAQRIEHFEMAGYGTARTWASHLGRTEIAEILQTTLEEEESANKNLTEIAQHSLDQHAGAVV